MTFVESIRRGFTGWGKIVTGNEMANAYFDNSRFGLLAALTLYTVVVLIAVSIQIVKFGVPTPMMLSVGIITQYLPLVAVGIATPLTYSVLRLPSSPRELMVPAVYLLTILFAIRLVIALVDVQALTAALGIMAYFLFRAARIVSGMSFMSALAYAVLTMVLLVGLPMTLYMLAVPGGGPI